MLPFAGNDGPRVVVIGGSIGGLNAALRLRQAGCRVAVCERSANNLTSRGAGIGLQPTTVEALTGHGIDPASVSIASHWVRYFSRGGGIAYEQPGGGRYTAWNTMYDALRHQFGVDGYHLGRRMVGVEERGERVGVRFADGTAMEAELVVCADGANSTGRALFAPQARPRYAGYVGWRGLVEERDLPDRVWSCFDDALNYYVLRQQCSHILIYPVPGAGGEIGRGQRRVNFVWYWNVRAGAALDDLLTDRNGTRRDSVPAGLLADRHAARLRSLADELLPPPVAQLVRAAQEPFVQPITELGVPRMVFGRVCLVGDAAFLVRPHAGAATAKATEDARVLSQALVASGGAVPAALAAWECSQLRMGRRLLAGCAEIGDRSQIHGTWRAGDPSLEPGHVWRRACSPR